MGTGIIGRSEREGVGRRRFVLSSNSKMLREYRMFASCGRHDSGGALSIKLVVGVLLCTIYIVCGYARDMILKYVAIWLTM